MTAGSCALALTLVAQSVGAQPPESPEVSASASVPTPPSKPIAFVEDHQGHKYAVQLSAPPKEQWDTDAADAIFKKGTSAYHERRYRDAIELYELAYAAEPSDGTVYSLGQAHGEIYEAESDSIHYDLAVRRYNDYLAIAGNDGFYAAAAATNLNRLAALKAGETPPTRLIVTSDTDRAWMTIDAGPRQSADGGVEVGPGEHIIEVGAPGHHTERRRVLIEEGQRLAVTVQLRALPGTIRVRGPKGAALAVDGVSYPKLPLSRGLELPSGRHFVTVTKRGKVPYSQELELHSEETLELDATTGPSTQRVLSYVLVGFGGAGLVTSAVTTGLAFSAQRRAEALEDRRTSLSLTTSEYESYASELQRRGRLRTAAIATAAAGGPLLVAGLLLMFIERPRVETPVLDRGQTAKARSRRSVFAAPVVAPGHAGAAAYVVF